MNEKWRDKVRNRRIKKILGAMLAAAIVCQTSASPGVLLYVQLSYFLVEYLAEFIDVLLVLG